MEQATKDFNLYVYSWLLSELEPYLSRVFDVEKPACLCIYEKLCSELVPSIC